jgi:Zn-finger nucleic acid-binding protein
MQCPDCSNQLMPIFYEDVQIHFCAACKGRLLNEQKLNKIETSRDESFERNKKYSQSRSFESLRSCPGCNMQMEKIKYGKFSPKTIDKCPQCSNIWLDEGELEDIQIAYEMYQDNLNKGKKPQLAKQTESSKKAPVVALAGKGFKCPKCEYPQDKGTECSKCGIIFAKYHAHEGQQINQDSKAERDVVLVDTAIADTSEFIIKQAYKLGEILTGFETANKYTIRAGDFSLNADEFSKGWTSQGLLDTE